MEGQRMECSLILANMVTSTQRYVSALVCMCMCTLHEFVVCGCGKKKTYNFTITVRMVTVIRYMKKNDTKESERSNALTNFVYLSSFSKPFHPLTSNAGKGDSQVAVAELHPKRF